MMILYHINQDFEHTGRFYPKIPKERLHGENDSIPRVCAAETIEGCLGSMPSGGGMLDETMYFHGTKFQVFRIDTEKLGLSLVLTSEELAERRLVLDARYSGEHWILNEFIVPKEDIFRIEILSYDIQPMGFDNHVFYEKMEELGMGVNEFYESEHYDPQDHTDDFGLISELDYRVVET